MINNCLFLEIKKSFPVLYASSTINNCPFLEKQSLFLYFVNVYIKQCLRKNIIMYHKYQCSGSGSVGTVSFWTSRLIRGTVRMRIRILPPIKQK